MLFHRSADNCPQCHVNPVSFSAVSTDKAKVKELADGPDKLCQGCHPEAHPGHGTGLRPRMNKLNLPLDEQGRMTCAYTCHNVHPAERSPYGGRMLRHDTDSLCLSCHPK